MTNLGKTPVPNLGNFHISKCKDPIYLNRSIGDIQKEWEEGQKEMMDDLMMEEMKLEQAMKHEYEE